MSELCTQTKLMGNMMAATTELLEEIMKERGRGFASDREAWAMLQECIERTVPRVKEIEKIQKELWVAVKEKNEDAFCALCCEFQRSALQMAMDWATASTMANIAVLDEE